MSVVWIVACGLLIGAILGGLGGGGAVLTVPVLVYLFGESAQQATTASLVIVGLTSVAGMLSYLSANRVMWRIGVVFGLVGIPATFVGSLGNHLVDEDVLLLGFAGLMLAATVAMLRDGPEDSTADDDAASVDKPLRSWRTLGAIMVAAVGVGLLTGFFGAGGGFVIVPALVVALGLPMQQAVGTSLMIVALNSASSLAARATTAQFDWEVIVPFTLAAMLATLGGKKAADKLPDQQLKRGFAALLVLVAVYTAWHSLQGL